MEVGLEVLQSSADLNLMKMQGVGGFYVTEVSLGD